MSCKRKPGGFGGSLPVGKGRYSMRGKWLLLLTILAVTTVAVACSDAGKPITGPTPTPVPVDINIGLDAAPTGGAIVGPGTSTPNPTGGGQQPAIIDIGVKPNENATPTPTAVLTPSDDDPTPTPTQAVQAGLTAADLKVSLNGNSLTVGDDFLPYVDKMGTTARIVEGQACLDGGYDTNYYYGEELAVFTVAKDGKQIIYDIYITSGKYPAAKGVTVGRTSKEEVYDLYGDPTTSRPAADTFSVSGSKVINVEYDGDIVSGISINDSSIGG